MTLLGLTWLPAAFNGLPLAAVVLIGVAALYYALLPSPIPGIPYDRRAALNPLGDIPALLAHYRRHGRVSEFFSQRCLQHKSPVIQVLLGGKALVVVSDLREIHDIATRRAQEFDRDDLVINTFAIVVGKGTITMKSHAAAFADQRKIWNSTMTDQFLYQVAAPNLHRSSRQLMQLWKTKSALSGGKHAFAAASDVRSAIVDALWMTAVGAHTGAVQSQLQLLQTLDRVGPPRRPDEPVEFPAADPPRIVRICNTFLGSTSPSLLAPSPRVRNWLMRLAPAFQTALHHKVRMLDTAIHEGREKYAHDKRPTGGKNAASAVDFFIQRESDMLGRKDKFTGLADENFRDEILSFLLAGLETTATTFTWALKYLTDHPKIQNTLRKALSDTFPDCTSTTPPPVEDICRANIPYLDATLAEILRCAHPAAFASRQATVNAKILGRDIPQGTLILFALDAEPVNFDEEIVIDESLRSTSSQQAGQKWQSWSRYRKRDFEPMRWIRTDEKGVDTFDPQAGPSLPFSAGRRGCAGKKLAMLELRLLVFALVWEATLKEVPEKLSGYEVVEAVTKQPRQCFIRL